MSVELGPQPITPLPLEPAPDSRRERRRRRRERNRTPDPEREAAQARKKQIRRWVGLAIVLAIVAAIIVPVTLWGRYSTAYVTSRNATVKGSITQVGAQIDGVVSQVEVEAGERVEKGQVLVRFEDHQLQANLLRARSRLNEAISRTSSAQTRIDAAQSQRNEAKVRYDQRVQLARTGAISLDELRTAETRLRTAEAMERTSFADHDATGAEVSTAQAEMAIAHADLEAAVIRAPAAGKVVRRISEPGASVVVGQPVIALLIGDEVWVEAWIDQANLSRIAVGNQVKVTISSFPGRIFLGKVTSIGVSTDFELPESAVPQSRNERMRTTPVVPVRVRLDDSEGLMPGLSAEVAIQRTPPRRVRTQ